MDSRRFGRIKILDTPDPHSVMPLKGLGWDAISKMATYEQFEATVLKRKCPIKALLLNQKFLAGVGNWSVAIPAFYMYADHIGWQMKSYTRARSIRNKSANL